MSESRAHRPPTQKGLAFLGAVAGGLVHEVRNPLSTMNVTLQLLQEDWPEGEGGDRERRLSRRIRTLRAEVNRLEEILDDFLRYAGIRKLNLSRVDLNRVLEDVTGFIAPECARAEVDLLFYPDRALPIMRLDERLVKQAVLNLFLNALQAMESAANAADPERATASGPSGVEGGATDAGPQRRDRDKLIVRTGIESDFARIDVIDTGPGIPEEIQDRVWEVYFSRRRQGSGLGLPTSRRIAEEHGGDLRFETEVGKGTDFILRLPLAGPPGEDEAS